MAKYCELTGVGPTSGNLVSHSNVKTKTRWLPNLKDKQYFISELGKTISIRLSTRAIRTIDKQIYQRFGSMLFPLGSTLLGFSDRAGFDSFDPEKIAVRSGSDSVSSIFPDQEAISSCPLECSYRALAGVDFKIVWNGLVGKPS